MLILNLSPIYHVPNRTSNHFSHQFFAVKFIVQLILMVHPCLPKDQRTKKVLQANFSHGLYSISNSMVSPHGSLLHSFAGLLIVYLGSSLITCTFEFLSGTCYPFLPYLILCHVYILGMRQSQKLSLP